MNLKSLAAVVEGIAPVVKEFVARELESFGVRLKALEERAPVPGPAGPIGPAGPAGERGERGADGVGERGADGAPGAPGERGESGPAGPVGPQGERGADGAPGEHGRDGEPGPKGESGERGPAGPEGPEGKPGRDGRDGTAGRDGERGEKGLDGKDGRDGINGRDGTLENLKLVQVSDRVIRFCFKDGTPIEGGEIRLGHPLDRGMFKGGTAYEQGDGVTFAGAFWIAQRSTDAEPGTGGDTGWRKAVDRGKQGSQGPQGPRGEFVTVKADGRR